ncbi:hypothetical protein ACHHRT_07565 [Desulfurivibrio sp. D14AmB]|uniref:hypothetical protein n=1 Tax=Desulfurivibrio sp. D14AmB TaxID=3374370 RepID=UPI00376EE9C6
MPSFIEPSGHFRVIVHRPGYRVRNLRCHDFPATLGLTTTDQPVTNSANFPPDDLEVTAADLVYEIPNPLTFRGTTFISRAWAETRALNPAGIALPPPPKAVSLRETLPAGLSLEEFLRILPRPLRLTLAGSSRDPVELVALAAGCCEFVYGAGDPPPLTGLRYRQSENGPRPVIHDHDLYETVANNPQLPAPYKEVMVLRPGAQGGSEIVGEYGEPGGATHTFEYLRRNSYIPWGHYAANLADDAVRYRIDDLTPADMTGLRHLYYQRTYLRLAEMLGLPLPWRRRTLNPEELEELRRRLLPRIQSAPPGLPFTATLWGWNFGYDFSGSGFRLHASHQQIHQQYALIPPPPAFACGDQVSRCCAEYRQESGRGLFADYLRALKNNTRVDGRPQAPSDLIIHEDRQVMLFVPKAQVSQWELQIVCREPVGNILEADTACRAALDSALLLAQRILAALGATLVTSLEYAKRLDNPDPDQHLLYSLLPKLPWSMGAFSEAQQRFICGHYPEDFAAICREKAKSLPSTPPPPG